MDSLASPEWVLCIAGTAVEVALAATMSSHPAARLWFVFDASRCVVLLWIMLTNPKNYPAAWMNTAGILTALIACAAFEAWNEQRHRAALHMTAAEMFLPSSVVGMMLAICIGTSGSYGIWKARILVSFSIWLAIALTWAYLAIIDDHGGSPPAHAFIFLCWSTFDLIAYVGQLNGENRKFVSLVMTSGQLSCFLAWGVIEAHRRRKVQYTL